MTSGVITTSAPGVLERALTSPPWAATSASSGFSISNAIKLFIIVALIALVIVIVLAVRLRRAGGPGSGHAEEIKRAAAADVEAIEEDDKFVSPDAPGRQEDDL